jgi:hypothetical protein
VEYLQRPDSTLSITAALVDCNRPALESLLGITSTPTSAPSEHTSASSSAAASILQLPGLSLLSSAVTSSSSSQSPSPSVTQGQAQSQGHGQGQAPGSDTPTGQGQQAKRESLVGFFSAASAASVANYGAYFSGGAATASTSAGSKTSGDENATSNTTSEPTASSTSTASSTASEAAASTTEASAPAPAPSETLENTKQLFSSWGKKLSVFSASSLETIKKSAASIAASAASAAAAADEANAAAAGGGGGGKGSAADDNDGYIEDDGMGPREFEDSTKINISRTDQEREQALSLHKLSGLRKGDKVTINRADLPGAVLFPAIKYKTVPLSAEEIAAEAAKTASMQPVSAAASVDAQAAGTGAAAPAPVSAQSDSATAEGPAPPAAAAAAPVTRQVQVHRYLVVCRERFIVLDARGGGVGSQAVVKSNRHLTEVHTSLPPCFRDVDTYENLPIFVSR